MAERATAANPDILRWARERSGRSVEEVARYLKKNASVIESWERGDLSPTIGQLEKLAYQLYKRPLAIFFPRATRGGDSGQRIPNVAPVRD